MRMIIFLLTLVLFTNCGVSKNKYPNYTKDNYNYLLWVRTQEPWVTHYKDVVIAVNKGAEIDYIDGSASDGQTPFLNATGALAVLKKFKKFSNSEIDSMEIEAVKIVKYLVKKGANIHATTLILKLNALHMAANGGREKMIPVLVKLGLDINSRNGDPDYGTTVLLHAITSGDLATVKAVVDAGADVNLCLFDGNSPLDWAEAYAINKKYTWHRAYDDQQAIADYMKSIGAKHGKNNFKGYLYFDKDKR